MDWLLVGEIFGGALVAIYAVWNVLNKFLGIYVQKVDGLYKGILKNYSVKLADGIRTKKSNQIYLYKSIFI